MTFWSTHPSPGSKVGVYTSISYGTHTFRELCRELPYSEPCIRNSLNALKEEGKVVRKMDGGRAFFYAVEGA